MNKDPKDNEPLYMPKDIVYFVYDDKIYEATILIANTHYDTDGVTHTYKVRDILQTQTMTEPALFESAEALQDSLIEEAINKINHFPILKPGVVPKPPTKIIEDDTPF